MLIKGHPHAPTTTTITTTTSPRPMIILEDDGLGVKGGDLKFKAPLRGPSFKGQATNNEKFSDDYDDYESNDKLIQG